jgi:hypothetical protein
VLEEPEWWEPEAREPEAWGPEALEPGARESRLGACDRPASTIYRKVGPKARRKRRTLIGRPMGEQKLVEQNRTRTAPGNTLPPSGGPTSVIVEAGFSRYLLYLHTHKIKKNNNSKQNKKK